MINNQSVRVRFAPSPTGYMHLGNVRTALLNYLFAQQKHGSFIVRIEDTDTERNFDQGATQILDDLRWLGLKYVEGPETGGPHAPYFQSERTLLYEEKLAKLIATGCCYRCFCSAEELEKKRQRQVAMHMAPRYDRTCLKLTPEQVQKNLDAGIPFMWRVQLDYNKSVTIHDLAHGDVTFEYKNFSDFSITRPNGSHTFMFANFVDDMEMKISHIIRGSDHLTNTACQAALYEAFHAPLPTFWHLPILCNVDGKKLSKRDFGFALRDLREAGYLPEAICNYLAIIGGSFEQEIMSLDHLVTTLHFDHIHAQSQVKYDVEKLNWVNHKWLAHYDAHKLARMCRPYLTATFPQAHLVSDEQLAQLMKAVQTDLLTLKDCVSALAFYFEAPTLTAHSIAEHLDLATARAVAKLVAENMTLISQPTAFLATLKTAARSTGIELKALFSVLRLALMGSIKGPGIQELIDALGVTEAQRRIAVFITLIV
jgi:nondiscriminating glutamyl-tRNA synthetase